MFKSGHINTSFLPDAPLEEDEDLTEDEDEVSLLLGMKDEEAVDEGLTDEDAEGDEDVPAEGAEDDATPGAKARVNRRKQWKKQRKQKSKHSLLLIETVIIVCV